MRAWSATCLFLAVYTGGAGSLDAREEDAEAPVPAAIRDTNNSLSFSAVERHVVYREQNDGLLPGAPETLDTESGWIHGFMIEGRLQQPALGLHDFFFRARVALTWGELDYDGGTQINQMYVPTTLTTRASMTDLGLTVGAGIGLGQHLAVTPLITYGFRFWKRVLNDNGLGAYHEEYSSHELAAGAMAQILIGERVVATAGGMVGGIFHASVYIQPAPAASLALGRSVTFHGEGSLEYKIVTSPLVHLFASYDVCSFGFGRSPMKATNGADIVEPESATFQHEVRAGLLFGF